MTPRHPRDDAMSPHPDPEPESAPTAADTAKEAGSPTLEERQHLVHALQRRALTRKDPFRANLEMVSGDVV